ncbi:bacterioferritin-associated ferredoxin, partial [Klebsiella pneumoniae]
LSCTSFSYARPILTFTPVNLLGFRIYRETLSRFSCAASVGEWSINEAIASGCASVGALGGKLKCGTNCGSCVPELNALLAAQRTLGVTVARGDASGWAAPYPTGFSLPPGIAHRAAGSREKTIN